MSQHDGTIANGDGATVRTDIQSAIQALLSTSSGNSRPSTVYSGQMWIDTNTPSATVWTLYVYDGTDDISLGTINTTSNTFTPSNALQIGMGKGAITGLTYANNGSDPTNDIDIAAGWCMDATGARQLQLSALTKRLDAAWAVGTNQGALDTGSIGNNDYYIWAIERSDTGVTDILFSLSATAPTMPTDYDYKRLIGWFKRASATIVPFTTSEMAGGGLDFRWTTSRLDVDLANTLTTSRRTDALSVPLNFSTIALIRTMLTDSSANFNAIICCPDESDAAPSATAVPLLTHSLSQIGSVATGDMAIKTSATGTIAARATISTVDAYRVATYGFQWSRR